MELQLIEGDIQVTDKQTIVLPVSCDGRVESNIFHPILNRYPEMWAKLLNICRGKLLTKGKLWLYHAHINRNVLAFPIRDSILDDYRLEYVKAGLQKFVDTYQAKGITSCAFPILGQAQGVETTMENYLSSCDIPVSIYIKNIPLSEKIIPPIEKFCGKLSPSKIAEIKRRLCFETN